MCRSPAALTCAQAWLRRIEQHTDIRAKLDHACQSSVGHLHLPFKRSSFAKIGS